MGKVILAVGAMLLITGCVGVALANHGEPHHCGPWIDVDESMIDLGPGLGELPRAAFIVVRTGDLVENEYDEQGNKIRMRACARSGESGVGWSVCYRSRDVDCWGRSSPVASSQSGQNPPAPTNSPGTGGRGRNSVPLSEPLIMNGPNKVMYKENGVEPVATYKTASNERRDLYWALEGDDVKALTMSDDGVVSFMSPPDFENPEDQDGDGKYEVRAMVSDESSSDRTDATNLIVIVTAENEIGPVNGDIEVSAPEGYVGVLARYEVVDPEEDAITWSLDGPDALRFQIDQEGNLSAYKVLDYEAPSSLSGTNLHSLTVTAADSGSPQMSSHLDVMISVSNVNEAPEAFEIPDLNLTVGDNPSELNLGDYFTDPDGDDLTYALVDSFDSSVAATAVDEDTLSIAPFGAGSFSVHVSGTDAGGLSAIATVNVTVMSPEPVRDIDPTLDYDIVVMPIVNQYADPAYGNLRAAVEVPSAVSYLEQDVGGNSDTTSGSVPSISPRLLPPATPSPTVAPPKDEISMPPASSIPSSTDGSFSTPSPEATQAASEAVSSPGTMEPKGSPVVKDSVSPTERDKSAPDPATAASETADDEGFSLWLIVLLFVLGLLALALIRTRVIKR